MVCSIIFCNFFYPLYGNLNTFGGPFRAIFARSRRSVPFFDQIVMFWTKFPYLIRISQNCICASLRRICGRLVILLVRFGFLVRFVPFPRISPKFRNAEMQKCRNSFRQFKSGNDFSTSLTWYSFLFKSGNEFLTHSTCYSFFGNLRSEMNFWFVWPDIY